jgi:hypothetical protein
MLKSSTKFTAACITERSAPFLRWKRAAGTLGPSFGIFAQERACRRRCIGAFDRAHSTGPVGVPAQQLQRLPNAPAIEVPLRHPPRLPNAPTTGVLVRHPPRVPAASAGPRVGSQLGPVAPELRVRRSPSAGRMHGALAVGAVDVLDSWSIKKTAYFISVLCRERFSRPSEWIPAQGWSESNKNNMFDCDLTATILFIR